MTKIFADRKKIIWGYENIEVNCPHCKIINIFNRAEDIGTFNPIGEEHKEKCSHCFKVFYFNGDIINPSYEIILLGLLKLIEEKKYIQALIHCCQSYEMFFLHFIRIQLIAKAYFRNLEELNKLYNELNKKIRSFSFYRMKNLFLNLIVRDIFQPINLKESNKIINRIKEKSILIRSPKKSDIPKKPKELTSLYNIKVNTLRNNILHKYGYRPRKKETKKECICAIKTLRKLALFYDVNKDFNWYINRS